MNLRYTNTDKLQIVKKIDKFRANGLTLVQAAEKAGVSYTSYTNWRTLLTNPGKNRKVARRRIVATVSRTTGGRIARRAA